MSKRRVIVELKYNKELAAIAFSAAPVAEKELDSGAVPKIAGVTFDKSFAPANMPGIRPRTAMDTPYVSGLKFDLALEPEEETYIVRADVEENKVPELEAHPSVVGVYADVEIEPAIICPADGPMGTVADVERLLCVKKLHSIAMDGSGVLVAIVDTGINLAYLAARGKPITLDAARSWVPTAGMVPGNAPVGHGTMCAFDAAITAPRATFLDIQLLRSGAAFSGFLSDAVRAYSHLSNVMMAPRRPGESRSMVVNNSWAMFHPSWDFPVGHPGNYSDNPNHPFNRIVGILEQQGADILFAAGNCGSNCADGRCGGVTTNTIYGANGHPSVLTVGGVDISKSRVGYSSQGPGRLSRNKPDLCGYTHFRGSGVYAADGGTSAATPVVAGVVAAVRTKRPFTPGNPSRSPAAVRALMRSSTEDLGTAGFDFDHGFGVVGGCKLFNQLFRPIKPIDCKRYPWLCSLERIKIHEQIKLIDICRKYPQICAPRQIERPPRPRPVPGSIEPASELGGGADLEGFKDSELGGLLELTWRAGYQDGLTGAEGIESTASTDWGEVHDLD